MDSGPECEPNRRGGGLHLKGASEGKLVTISRNWPALPGVVPLGTGLAKPEDMKASKEKVKRHG